jgi:hypothetical protein
MSERGRLLGPHAPAIDAYSRPNEEKPMSPTTRTTAVAQVPPTVEHRDYPDGHLDVTECLFLLRWATVGRVAVAVAGEAPVVQPVPFLVDGDDIVFAVEASPLLRTMTHQPVSFEADGFDRLHQVAWNVLVQGLALEIDDPGTLPARDQGWPERRGVVLRLCPSSIIGQRSPVGTGIHH